MGGECYVGTPASELSQAILVTYGERMIPVATRQFERDIEKMPSALHA
jgi:hypothetical protein